MDKKKKAGGMSSAEIVEALEDDGKSSKPASSTSTSANPASSTSAKPTASTFAKPSSKPDSSPHVPGAASMDLFDSTMPPLSESMMEELDTLFTEKEKEKNLDERIFSEDIEHELDPDFAMPDLEDPSDEEDEYEVFDSVNKTPKTPRRARARVIPTTPAMPSTPKTSRVTAGTSTPFRTPTGKRKRTVSEPPTPPSHSAHTSAQRKLFAAELKLLPGARSKKPIYAFFLVDDEVVKHSVSGIETTGQKRAICQIKNGGAICGAVLKQSDSTTSSLRSHIRTQHKPERALWEAECERIDAINDGTFARIKHLYQVLGGVHETQADADAAEAEVGKKHR